MRHLTTISHILGGESIEVSIACAAFSSYSCGKLATIVRFTGWIDQLFLSGVLLHICVIVRVYLGSCIIHV